jgi:hypothetical protein
MSRTLRPLAALAVLAAISAGCGGTGSSGDTSTAAPAGKTGTVSSSTGTASSTGTGGNSTATPREKAVKFAECMRENGYADFPDPKASGEFPSFGISVTPAVWVKALRACKELQPPGSFSAHLSPKELSAARKFAQCVREHGVKDFPDPVQGQPIIDTTIIPSANRPGGMAILNAATQKCGALMGDLSGDGAGGTGG